MKCCCSEGSLVKLLHTFVVFSILTISFALLLGLCYIRLFADILLSLIRFVLQHGGRALIADEMGLGKTIQVSNW